MPTNTGDGSIKSRVLLQAKSPSTWTSRTFLLSSTAMPPVGILSKSCLQNKFKRILILFCNKINRFTLDKFRPKLYDLHKQFATLVASKAPVVPAPAPTLATESKKKGKGKVAEVPEPTAAVTKAEEAPEPAKKQGKKGKGTDEVPEVAAKQQVTNEAAVAPVAKKSKTAVPASEPVEAVKNEKPKGGAKRPAEEQPVPTPQLPSPKRQAKAPVATPSTPVQALAPSTPATPPSGEYVTAPSSPATPSTTAAVTPKTILRTRSSKLVPKNSLEKFF